MNEDQKKSVKRFVQYLRVSTDKQDVDNQRLEILKWANANQVTICEEDSIEMTISSKKSVKARGLEELQGRLNTGDCLVVAELSRLGRSLGEIVTVTESLVNAGRGLICLKERIEMIPGDKVDIQTRVTIGMFGIFAELERSMIGLRTSAAIKKIQAGGGTWGRKPGVLCKSKCDKHREVILELMGKGVSHSSIGKIIGINKQTLHSYIMSRKLKEEVAAIKASKENVQDA